MKRFALVGFTLTCTALVGLAQAADDKAKADPTGTWKWSTTFNNQARETTLKLKLEGDKLMGVVLGRDNAETKIDDAAFKDGTVSFAVTRERNGQKFTTKYKDKLDADTIKGTADSERDGQTRSREWEAKREKK
ncbi:MAG: hypothetical protein HZA46_03560 [Planctomycetales bacterium]|nr:hypothetical protein [Planctomycetales bacterium]